MITVYSKNNCMQCKMVKKWLTNNNLGFIEINIDEYPEYVDKLLSWGIKSVPYTVATTHSFSGFNPPELAKLLG